MSIDRFRFRAWDKKRNRMIDLYKLTPLALDPDWYKEQDGERPDGILIPFMESIIILQCTGLRDAEGMLIWEGDVIFDEIDDVSTVVYWNDKYGCFRTKVPDTEEMGFYDYSLQAMATVMKVIGNIYEHSHLITQPGKEG